MKTEHDYSKAKIKQYHETRISLLEDLGREPKLEEIAEEMGIDNIEEIRELSLYTLEEDNENDFELRFKLTIKNHELEKLRFKRNLTQEQVAEKIGISGAVYNAIENCRHYPLESQMNNLAKFFKVSIDSLFPAWLSAFSQKWRDNESKSVIIPISKLKLNSPEVLALQSGDHEEIIRQADNKIVNTVVNKAMSELTPRESGILKYRFGINDDSHTLEETAKKFYVTRERIRQIESKALHKLRQYPGIRSCG